MRRDRIVQLVAIGLMGVAVLGASLLAPGIEAQRDELQLDPPVELGGKLSPHMQVLAAATGAFRGLFVDMLWYRIERLKQEGKFHEINTLANFITDLQPRFAEVWRYHAWNLAYNISVATHTPEERWDWVSKGISLLRDKGIPFNPRAVNLYRELGWIFFHKVGQYSDDMHWYYKRKLAYEWQEVLSAPPRGATTEQEIDNFRKIAEAPDALAALLNESPDVEPLILRLAEMNIELDQALLREIGRIFMFNYLEGDSLVGRQVRELPELYRSELVAVLQDPKLGAGLPDLLAFLRKRTLVRHYHMNPQYMLELMELYGPLDWRHAATHGAYWSDLGADISEGVRSRKGLDLLNTNRQTVHAMQELAGTGHITFDPISGYLTLTPDVRFLKSYETAWEVAIERVRRQEDIAERTDAYAPGHENFLLRAMTDAYLYGDREQAQHYYDRVRELYGQRPGSIGTGKYLLTLDDQVLKELGENLENTDRSLGFIDAVLTRSFTEGLANNRMAVFENFVDLARRVQNRMEQRAIANPTAVQRRMSFGSFEQMFTAAFERFMLSPQFPPLVRQRAWSNAPLRLRQRVYDKMVSALRQEAISQGFDFDRAFPEPAGMEAYRATRQADPAGVREPETVDTIRRE